MKSMSVAAVLATVGLSLAALPNSAQAFSLSIAPQYGSTENTGASALLDFNFVQKGSDVLLNLGMTNTTNGKAGLGATQATLVGVAFDTIAGVQASAVSGNSNFTQLWTNVDLSPSNQFGVYDVGVSTPRNQFEGGNANGGLKAGESTLVSFLFKGSNLNASTVESSFLKGFQSGDLRTAARFQQVNAGGGSDKVAGALIPPIISEPGTPDHAAGVPEPGSILGMLAAGGLLFGRKKRGQVAGEAK